MRVLFLSQIVPYPPHGGVLQRGYNLLRELGRHAEVTLFAFVHSDEMRTEAEVRTSREALERFCKAVEYFPLWVKDSPVGRPAALTWSACSSRPFSVIAHRSPSLRRRVSQLLRENSYDLLHVDTVALSQFVPRPAPLATVLTHHNIESALMMRRARVEPSRAARLYLTREARKLDTYERMVVPTYNVNVTVSTNDRNTLASRIPSAQTMVVPNGVDVEYFTPGPQPESPTMIYTGGMNMFANRDAVMFFLTEVWPHIRAAVPEARFYAVGQDPPAELRALSDRDPHIVATGFVGDIRPYVRDSAVYVVPIRVGGGTRLKVLDAMAMGKAIVSTSVGCEGIGAKRDEHLVVADDPVSFARATARLLADAGRRAALGRSARALVEQRYSWPIIARALLDAYRLALESGAADRRHQNEVGRSA